MFYTHEDNSRANRKKNIEQILVWKRISTDNDVFNLLYVVLANTRRWNKKRFKAIESLILTLNPNYVQ